VSDDTDPSVNDLSHALSTFIDTHRHCGDLSSDVIDMPGGPSYVWMACDGCGARLERDV
jgi:hypothetical protein